MNKPLVEEIVTGIFDCIRKSYDEAVAKYGEEEVIRTFPKRMEEFESKNFGEAYDSIPSLIKED